MINHVWVLKDMDFYQTTIAIYKTSFGAMAEAKRRALQYGIKRLDTYMWSNEDYIEIAEEKQSLEVGRYTVKDMED